MSSHYKLIYGAPLEQIKKANVDQCVVVTEPFQIYRCPKHGQPEQEDIRYIQFVGIEYDRIYGVYERLVSSPDKLQFYDGNGVSEDIKQQFHQTYPQVEAKCYAIIQDVCTSYYTNVTLVYGYWMFNPPSQDQESYLLRDCGLGEWPEGHNAMSVEESIYDADYDYHRDIYPRYFYGVHMDTLATNEDSEACEQLARQLQTCYKPVTIRSRDQILSELRTIIPTIELSETPVITLILSRCAD